MLAFFVLASFPLLAAIGHDVYLYSLNPDKAFELTAAGFLWTKYHPESYKQAIDMLPAENWETINQILTFKTVYIAAVISLFFYALIIIAGSVKGGKAKKNKSAQDAAKQWKKR